MEDRTCNWVVLLREYLESSGDTGLVRELWPTLTRLLDWYRNRRTARGLVLAREWEVWDNPLRYEVCEGAGLNAMVYRALEDASVLATSIGRKKEAQRACAGGAAVAVGLRRVAVERAGRRLRWRALRAGIGGSPPVGPCLSGSYRGRPVSSYRSGQPVRALQRDRSARTSWPR